MGPAATASTPASTRSARARACATSAGNNSGGLSRCVSRRATNNCTASGTGTRASAAAGPATRSRSSSRSTSSTAGSPAATTARRPASRRLRPLIAGTTRVWETITGGNATAYASELVRDEQPVEPEHDEAVARQPLVHQPGEVLAEVVERGDRRHERRQRLDRLQPRHRRRGPGELGQRDRRQHRPAEPPGPRRSPSIRRRRTSAPRSATRRSAASTPTRRPARVTSSRCRAARTARRSPGPTRRGNLPDIPVDSVIVNPNFPQQVFAGTDFGLYFTDDITRRVADVVALRQRPAQRDDLGHADRPRLDHALALDARPRRLRVAAAERAGEADQTIDFGPLPDKVYGDPDFEVSATASSGLPVSFIASGNCTVTGTTVHLTGPGSCTITARSPATSTTTRPGRPADVHDRNARHRRARQHLVRRQERADRQLRLVRRRVRRPEQGRRRAGVQQRADHARREGVRRRPLRAVVR